MKHGPVIKAIRWIFIGIPLIFIALSLCLTVLYKYVPVKITPLMVERFFSGKGSASNLWNVKWQSLDEMSPEMARCVIASEDARFFTHNGFDLIELKKASESHRKSGKPMRGCSTISQQTAKNCFTFCTHTYARKAIEAYYTVLIEKIWGKRRILEVYLNIAEMGPGIYGAEAAARHFWNKSAAKLSATEAATLTCCLPNPLKRSPEWVSRHMSRRRSEIVSMSRQVRLAD